MKDLLLRKYARWSNVSLLMVFVFVFSFQDLKADNIGNDKGRTIEDAQQQKTITGTVIDEQGQPLPGVSIIVKGKQGKGTSTDFDGKYAISVLPTDRLVFSYIGFAQQEVLVGGKAIINVTLSEDTQQLDDVVVVGHGTQKKIAVSGAVSTVKGADIKMPASNLTSVLAGQMPGIISETSNGEPGSVSQFYIRGIGTFGGRLTPLIILDDAEIQIGDLNSIPPETVESFSILKDASATAIYGSRGANGVMIIKTKSGNKNERTRIGVTYEQSFNVPTMFPKFVDGATWMELYNEASTTRRPYETPRYSQQVIDATRSGINPYMYPDVDWEKVLFKKMALSHRANINMQGGGDKTTYYMSIQANHDTGLLNTAKAYSWDNNIDIWKYNFQNNISYSLAEGTDIELRMNAQLWFKQGMNKNAHDIFGKILVNHNPISFPVMYPAQPGDRHIRFGNSVLTGANLRGNPYAEMLSTYKEQRENIANTTLKLRQDLDFITKGLTGTVLVSFKNYSANSYTRSVDPFYYRIKDGSYDPATQEYELERLGTSGTEYISQSGLGQAGDQTFAVQASLNYDRKFAEDHHLGGMFLYHQREFKYQVLPERNQGLSARLTYNYKHKYLAEINAGYTGTERLASGSRFEFFPAASLGWVVSEENFFKPISDVVSFLKVRASYGLIGNDGTGKADGAAHFLYIDTANLNPADNAGYGYTTGEGLGFWKKGPMVTQWAVQNARWEKASKFNVGVDLRLFDDVNIVADYFYDKRYDILMKRRSWPNLLGFGDAIPWANVGKVDNWGYEVSINWNRQITDNLNLGLRANFTHTQNKIVNRDNPQYRYPWLADTGYPLSYTFGYIAEGLFKSQEEIDNSPSQIGLGSNPRPGDIKYRDITGDGVIDQSDRTMISEYGTTPRIQYGIGATLVYKKFDFNIFFSGSAKRTIMTNTLDPFSTASQNYDNNVFRHIADNRWTEANPNPNATYPRLGVLESDVANNKPSSTYWMRDGSFTRLKMIEIGYKFKHGRIYAVGNNLAVFSDFKQWDPELSWNAYPLQKVYSMGVQFNF
ncbi:SusC/RagA family TonB-linked outer membrane protein [Capnocytophaga canimorsus]|uniref:SusC/RagA family TonB-linked outer membrane protein n=1 Tax=Capnocytophaga canimorsus TaxID=28188 RepID=UPI0037CE4B4E